VQLAQKFYQIYLTFASRKVGATQKMDCESVPKMGLVPKMVQFESVPKMVQIKVF
jgi:hypothetical protein